MIHGLTGFLAAAAERSLRDFLLTAAAATLAALFAAVSPAAPIHDGGLLATAFRLVDFGRAPLFGFFAA
jgi:hypothetical protein